MPRGNTVTFGTEIKGTPYRSFAVESKLQRAEQLTHRYKVTGVPVMVVNGKYTADVGTAGGEEQLMTLLNDLATSEHKR